MKSAKGLMRNFSVGVFVEIMPLLIQSFHFLNLDHLRSTNTPKLASSSYTERQTIWLEKVKKTFLLFLIFIIFGGGNITLKFRFVFSAFWKWNWALYWNACLKPTKQNKTNSPSQNPTTHNFYLCSLRWKPKRWQKFTLATNVGKHEWILAHIIHART